MQPVAVGVVHAELARAPRGVAKGCRQAESSSAGAFCMQCVGIVDEKAIAGSVISGGREVAIIWALQVEFHAVAADPGVADGCAAIIEPAGEAQTFEILLDCRVHVASAEDRLDGLEDCGHPQVLQLAAAFFELWPNLPLSLPSSSTAASAMTVPGGKMAVAPALLRAS